MHKHKLTCEQLGMGAKLYRCNVCGFSFKSLKFYGKRIAFVKKSDIIIHSKMGEFWDFPVFRLFRRKKI